MLSVHYWSTPNSCLETYVMLRQSSSTLHVSFRINAVSSVYDVSTVMSNSVIEDVVWDFFARSVL